MRRRTDGLARPYRLWDTKLNEFVRWRCYASPHNAHDGIWDVMKWYSDPGRTIELVNHDSGRALASYTLHLRSGKFVLEWSST